MATKARMCRGKEKHESRGKAESAMRSLVRRQEQDPDSLNVYPCNFCKFWHVGHVKEAAYRYVKGDPELKTVVAEMNIEESNLFQKALDQLIIQRQVTVMESQSKVERLEAEREERVARTLHDRIGLQLGILRDGEHDACCIVPIREES